MVGKKIVPSNTNANSRRLFMIFAVAANIIVFGYFKYMNFFVGQAFWLADVFGIPHGEWESIVLPIGISFFTFQKLSYLIDVYRGGVAPARAFHNYLLYVSLFPQLIAGPIVRYHDIAKQLVKRNFTTEIFLQGFWRFSLGLSKKVIIANVLGKIADNAFAMESAKLSTSAAWMGAFCYSFQIYFDFSGYSDMAIGLGRMLGFEFLENFNLPYISASFSEFWHRWHISLSNWMKEYLYIPLGGNRCSPFRNVANLWIVFILSGMWHGASWNFIVWGAYHGVFLSLDKFTVNIRKKIPRILLIPWTFVLVTFGWVCFRAETISDAYAYLRRMFALGGHGSSGQIGEWMHTQEWLVLGMGIIFSFAPAFIKPMQISDWNITENTYSGLIMIAMRSFLTAALLAICFMSLVTSDFNPFIYFRF